MQIFCSIFFFFLGAPFSFVLFWLEKWDSICHRSCFLLYLLSPFHSFIDKKSFTKKKYVDMMKVKPSFEKRSEFFDKKFFPDDWVRFQCRFFIFPRLIYKVFSDKVFLRSSIISCCYHFLAFIMNSLNMFSRYYILSTITSKNSEFFYKNGKYFVLSN